MRGWSKPAPAPLRWSRPATSASTGRAEKAPGHSVKAGDVVTIGLDRSVRVLKVVGFAERRGDAPPARVLYDDLQARPE